MDDFVDYEAYARSVPYDPNLVSIPEGLTYKSIRPLEPRESSPIRSQLSATQPDTTPTQATKPANVREPPQGTVDPRDLQIAHTAVLNNRPVNSHPATTYAHHPIPASLPLDRNHPNAATIPGLTPGTNRCDTCKKNHVSIIHPLPPFFSLFFFLKNDNKTNTPLSRNAATMPATAKSIPCWRLDRILDAGRGVRGRV